MISRPNYRAGIPFLGAVYRRGRRENQRQRRPAKAGRCSVKVEVKVNYARLKGSPPLQGQRQIQWQRRSQKQEHSQQWLSRENRSGASAGMIDEAKGDYAG